jgi:hypothetical protein
VPVAAAAAPLFPPAVFTMLDATTIDAYHAWLVGGGGVTFEASVEGLPGGGCVALGVASAAGRRGGGWRHGN